MRNFDWIFNAEGKVAEGKECVYDNCSSSDWDWYLNKPQVVTLAGYRPYYTDGTPDPKNEEVNEWCYIETNEYVRDECQLPLNYLFELEEAEEKEVMYDCMMYDVRGKYINDEGDEKYVLIDKNTEYLFVDKDDIQERHDVNLLDEEGYKTLFNEIRRGSFYLGDYKNSVGCTCTDVCSFCDGYYECLYDEFGEEYFEHDNLESWLKYAGF